MKKKLLFVINPISGGKSKRGFRTLIESNLELEQYDYDVYWWEQVDALPQELERFKEGDGYGVVAVGGDGTINVVARSLINSDKFLSIVPMGSGNGLARELKLSLKPEQSIQGLNKAKEQRMDVGMANGRSFVNVAGCGFDAQVSFAFAQLPSRGFWSYVKAVMSEFKSAYNYNIEVHSTDEVWQKQAFMLSIANGTQWGNDFFVAPDASYTDGALDLVFLKKPKLHQIPGLVRSLYKGKSHRLLSRIRLTSGQIRVNALVPTHYDGEPHNYVETIDVELLPGAVKLWI